MTGIGTEFRIAVRTLGRSYFGLVAVLTLGLGIALNVVVLAVVNAYLIKSLPYPGASRLYSVQYARPGQPSPRGLDGLPWDSLNDVVEHAVSWDLDMFYLVGGDHPVAAPGEWVTPGFMEGLGIHPALGRSFAPEEYTPGGPQVALISDGLWRNRFRADPAIVGKRLEAYLSDRPNEAELFTVIGVLPASFWHVNRYTEVLAPLRGPSYPYMVRLREGVPPAEAARRISGLVRQGGETLPGGWSAQLVSTKEGYVRRLRPILRAVATGAGLVLLIACANVAFLLLIRATRRQREIAVRVSLGAGWRQVARLLMIEAALLVSAATLVGLVLSRLTLDWLAPLAQQQLGRPAPGGVSAIALDGTVLALAVGCGLATAAVFSFAPMLTAWRTSLSHAKHGIGRSATEGRASRRARSVLIAMEVAGSLALLVGCGLMVRTVVNLLRVDFGYRFEHVLAGQVGLRLKNYPDPASQVRYYERLLPRLASIPGVRAAAMANWWVLQPPPPQSLETETGRREQAGVLAVSQDYLKALGVPVLDGRGFTSADRSGGQPVVVVSATLARRLWPIARAVGQRVVVPERVMGSPTPTMVRRTVVGVAGDVRQTHSDEELADAYIPLLQAAGRFTSVFVRTNGPSMVWLPALREAMKEVDGEVALDTPVALESLLDEQLARPRFLAWLLAAFGAFAAMLALIGVYGVIAYAVKQREREVALRMAVGADSRAVTGLFLRRGALVLAVGIIGGVAGAGAIGRMIESQLYGVHSGDVWTMAVASLGLGMAGLVAVWWPARRAARTDPAALLREE